MTELLSRPELAVAAALLVALLWLALGYWLQFRVVGDDVGARLDALAVGHVTEAAPADRYDRFERRDYSGDRGTMPAGKPPAVRRFNDAIVVPRWLDFYAETAARLGLDPLGA